MIFIRRWRNKSMTAPLCWRGNQYQSCVATFLLQTQFNHQNDNRPHFGHKREIVFTTKNKREIVFTTKNQTSYLSFFLHIEIFWKFFFHTKVRKLRQNGFRDKMRKF